MEKKVDFMHRSRMDNVWKKPIAARGPCSLVDVVSRLVLVEVKNKVGSPYQSRGGLQDHWMRRLVALVVDSVIVGVCTFVIEGCVFNPFSFPLFLGILSLWYFTLLEAFYGSTFGKRIMNLKTTKLDGRKPPFDLAFVRNVSKVYWVLVLMDTVIGLATSGDPRQKVTDRITGTTVVSTGGSPLVHAHSHLIRATKFCFFHGQRSSVNAKHYLIESYSHVSKLIKKWIDVAGFLCIFVAYLFLVSFVSISQMLRDMAKGKRE